MPWKTMDVQEQRVKFVVAASRKEKPFVRLCEEFGISRPTGLLWVERYRRGGVGGIGEQSRRPHSSPWQTAAQYDSSHSVAPRSSAGPGAAGGRQPALRTCTAQRALADGLQGSQALASSGGSAVGAR